MNMSIQSSPSGCSQIRPKCLTNVPGTWFTFINLTVPWCNGGETIDTWKYEYNACFPEKIAQVKTIKFVYLECRCIEDPLQHCFPFLYANKTCDYLNVSIFILQLIILMVGTILNSIIQVSFYNKRPLRRKIPSILLFNQATSDLFSCSIYVLPNVIYYLGYLLKLADFPYMIIVVLKRVLILTVTISIFLHTIIAIERYLSICKPMWHRAKVQIKHIWSSVIITWFMSLLITVICHFANGINTDDYMIDEVMHTLMAILAFLITLITVLYLVSVIEACKSLYMPSSSNTQKMRAKKQLRLTLLFFVMFATFLTGFIPVLVGLVWRMWQLSFKFQLLFLFFNLTSALNPMLTLSMRKEFRSKCVCFISDSKRSFISNPDSRRKKTEQSNIPSSTFGASTSANLK